MCGRFTNSLTGEELGAYFDVSELDDYANAPAWNIRPTDPVPVIFESPRHTDEQAASAEAAAAAAFDAHATERDDPDSVVRRLMAGRWSLVPSWSRELKTKFPTFNARSETAAEKASFKNSVRSKRAILPASGYYEWKTVGKTKTPYYIHDADEPLAFAGLYSWWRAPGSNEWILTATILTREAVGGLRDIHDRTPVTLPRHFVATWLDPTIVGDQGLVDAAVEAATPVAEALDFHIVGPVTGDSPDLVNPL
jgi:putative SOS response-associated peptidase YedK